MTRTGDGILMEFRSVVDAVRCSIEVQNGMVEHNATPERQILFRAGIRLGDAIEDCGWRPHALSRCPKKSTIEPSRISAKWRSVTKARATPGCRRNNPKEGGKPMSGKFLFDGKKWELLPE